MSGIPRFQRPHLGLAPTRQGMADELPVDEVGRVVDGAAREVLKRARAEEVIRPLGSADDAHGRVRVEAPDDRVLKG